MAVAHSAASESHPATTGSVSQTSFSWTHTQTGTPQGVLVFVHVANSTGNPVSTVTYGSATLERVSGGAAVDAAGEAGRTDLFFAGLGLPTGNQTITVNRANTTDIMYASAATVTAATNTNVTGIVLLEGDGALTVQSVTDGGAPTNSLRYAAAYSGLAAPPPAGTGSTLLNSIDFGNYGIALVRETTAGTGARNVGFNNATTDDRAAVHVAVRERWNRTDTQTVGALTLTGNDATFTKAAAPKVMDGGTGAFTLGGQPAATRHNVVIEGGTGAFSFTGNDATLTEAAASKVLTAETGAFTLTGNPASTLVAVQLGGDVGKFFLPERNQRQWSEEFNNAYWTKTNASITSNATTAPDGTLTADALIENTTPSVSHQVARNITYVTGKTYTHSCYFKLYPGPTTRYVRLQLGSAAVFGSDVYANINLATGLVTNTPGLGATTSVTNEGNGWYRASISLRYTGAGITSGPGITLVSTAGSALYTDADGLSGVYLWGVQWEESASVTAYDSTGPAGATDTALRQQYKLTAEVGAFAFTGQPATLAKGRTITAETGTFTAAGQPATLLHNLRIEASTGSFALSGGAPALLRGRYLSGGAGTFTETGQPATFRRTWAVQAATGAFSFTGNPAALTELGAYEIDPIVGAFTFTGQPAALAQSQSMPVEAGVFSFTGQPATLRQSQALAVDTGSFTATGQPITLARTWALQAASGAYALTGNPAALTELGTYEIDPVAGAFDLTGHSATLARSQTLAAAAGTFTATGQPAALSRNQRLDAAAGAFSITGNPATFALGGSITLAPSTGTFDLTGNPAALNVVDVYILEVTPGTFNLTGAPATFTYVQRRRVILIF